MSKTVRTLLRRANSNACRLGCVLLCGRKVRACDQERATRSNEGFVKIGNVQRHVRTVLPVKHQRKGIPILKPKQNESRQPIGIFDHVANVAPLLCQRLRQGTAHVIVANPGKHSGPQSKSRRICRDIARRTPKILRKRARILKPRTDLLRIKVDRKSSKTDHVKVASGFEVGGVLHDYITCQLEEHAHPPRCRP